MISLIEQQGAVHKKPVRNYYNRCVYGVGVRKRSTVCLAQGGVVRWHWHPNTRQEGAYIQIQVVERTRGARVHCLLAHRAHTYACTCAAVYVWRVDSLLRNTAV